MSDAREVPVLTADQQRALDEHDGILQGPEYVLMRPDALLRWLGYESDDLRAALEPAFEQVRRGDIAEWDLNSFLARMNRQMPSR